MIFIKPIVIKKQLSTEKLDYTVHTINYGDYKGFNTMVLNVKTTTAFISTILYTALKIWNYKYTSIRFNF